MEIWKDIPNFEGIYQASNLGRIKSLWFTSNYQHKKFYREKIMKPKISKDGCSRVELWKDGKHKTYLVYRLVATTFLENLIDTNMTVNHKDGNRLNNNIDNLEWLTLKENIQHGFRTGLYHCRKPIKLINKNNNQTIICKSMAEASELMGKNKSYISGKISKNIFENETFDWRYADDR